MNTKSIENLKDKLCSLLEEIEKRGSITSSELENIYKITTSIKNLDKIAMSESNGMSYGNGNSYGNSYGNSSYGNSSYRRGSSYADETMSMRDRMESMMSSGHMSSNDRAVLREAIAILDK